MSNIIKLKTDWLKRLLWITLGIIIACGAFVGGVYLLINQSNGELVSSGMVRNYLLYVPDTYDPASPTPLVISMHGFAEWPAHFRNISGWNREADEHGFIVVYPSGTGFPKRWIMDRNAEEFEDPLINITFISDLIDTLAGEFNIDEARIYANGFSNGGGMSFFLACELADRITAIGGVGTSGYHTSEECQPSRPVPIIAFHGTEDEFVSYYGRAKSSQTYQKTGIPDWIITWAERNGCSPDPVELPVYGEVSGIRYTLCNQNADVVLYTIHGGGHAWPGGNPIPEFIVGHTTDDIDASAEMWAFFRQFSLAE